MKISTSEAIYIQIANDIINKISNGYLSNGDKIDSVRKLSKHYLVTTNTILSTLDYLEKNKIIKRLEGVGVFVKIESEDLEEYYNGLALKYKKDYLSNMKAIKFDLEKAIKFLKEDKYNDQSN